MPSYVRMHEPTPVAPAPPTTITQDIIKKHGTTISPIVRWVLRFRRHT